MSTTYSFLSFACALVGPGGFVNLGNGSGASEEGITFTPSENISSMQIGADGAGQHSLHANRSGTISIRLLKTSPQNAALMALYNFQTSNPDSHGQNTLTGADKLRGDAVTCTQVAFRKAPDLAYAKEAGVNVWEFDAVAINRVLGV